MGTNNSKRGFDLENGNAKNCKRGFDLENSNTQLTKYTCIEIYVETEVDAANRNENLDKDQRKEQTSFSKSLSEPQSTLLVGEQSKLVQEGDVKKEADTVNLDNIDASTSIETVPIGVDVANCIFLEPNIGTDIVNDDNFDLNETFQKSFAHNFSGTSDDDTHTYSSVSLFPTSSSETSSKSIKFDQTNHISYMVETFQPLIVQTIQARELVPHIYFLDHTEFIHKENQIEAAQLLIDRIVGSPEPGKWQTFLGALKRAGYQYMIRLLRGETEEDQTINRKLLKLFTPRLIDRIDPVQFIDRLFEKEVINEADMQEVQCEQNRRGATAASFMLLDKVPRRATNWFDVFIDVLKECGIDDIAKDLDIRKGQPLSCDNRTQLLKEDKKTKTSNWKLWKRRKYKTHTRETRLPPLPPTPTLQQERPIKERTPRLPQLPQIPTPFQEMPNEGTRKMEANCRQTIDLHSVQLEIKSMFATMKEELRTEITDHVMKEVLKFLTGSKETVIGSDYYSYIDDISGLDIYKTDTYIKLFSLTGPKPYIPKRTYPVTDDSVFSLTGPKPYIPKRTYSVTDDSVLTSGHMLDTCADVYTTR